jgi:hypothetical protein
VTEKTPATTGYEAPQLTVLGSVHALTQTQDKKFGQADGFLFMGNSIMNASN